MLYKASGFQNFFSYYTCFNIYYIFIFLGCYLSAILPLSTFTKYHLHLLISQDP